MTFRVPSTTVMFVPLLVVIVKQYWATSLRKLIGGVIREVVGAVLLYMPAKGISQSSP